MLTTPQIESILEQFNVELTNFEIINIEEKKGWSCKYLFLVVEQTEQYILKGKAKDQLYGFMADIEISEFLKSNGLCARLPLKTKSGQFHFVQDDVYWDLKTYIPGSVSPFEEYTDESIISLAKINTLYINKSLNKPQIKRMELLEKDPLDIDKDLETFMQHSDILKSVIGDAPTHFKDWFAFAKAEISNILKKSTDFSIIHNDLNNKNILLDLHSNKVTSFIDWDHGCISTPIKDILEPINMFYDSVPTRYAHMREIYLNEINKSYKIKLSDSELNLIQVYYYALNKWQYISFFAKMIEDIGDSTNEKSKFEGIITTQLSMLNNLGKIYNVL